MRTEDRMQDLVEDLYPRRRKMSFKKIIEDNFDTGVIQRTVSNYEIRKEVPSEKRLLVVLKNDINFVDSQGKHQENYCYRWVLNLR